MPYTRVMGDAVITCDGKVVFLNGAGHGVAGWSSKAVNLVLGNGPGKAKTTYACKSRCTKADRDGNWEHLEPVIYDPVTSQWSKKGSLALAAHPRLYHSSALLLPSCQVMVAGSDVTNDMTAEFWSPPHLSIPNRPRIVSAPTDNVRPGDSIVVRYASADPIAKAILIRTGATTHSMAFGEFLAAARSTAAVMRKRGEGCCQQRHARSCSWAPLVVVVYPPLTPRPPPSRPPCRRARRLAAHRGEQRRQRDAADPWHLQPAAPRHVSGRRSLMPCWRGGVRALGRCAGGKRLVAVRAVLRRVADKMMTLHGPTDLPHPPTHALQVHGGAAHRQGCRV